MSDLRLAGNYLLIRYLPARLSANEGNITNTATCISLPSISLKTVCSPSIPPVTAIVIPITPKAIDAPINVFVAIFCII